jgi:energy-coupling factor transport system substrate-specific component
MTRATWPATVSFVLLNLLGLAAYLHPFFFAGVTEPDSRWFAHASDASLVFAGLAVLCLVLVVADLTGGTLNSRSLAALGVLAAFAAVLRTVTLPAGSSLYFFLVIVGGYAFGPRLGFLLGVLSFFLSAIVTGGFGPWLPFQMFAAGWMGLTMGAAGAAMGRWQHHPLLDVAIVVIGGIVWGFLFGVISNLWFWPFTVGGPDISYEPGVGMGEALRRYWNFYLLTSAGWDLLRAVTNTIVLVMLARPLLRAMLRFRDRFTWEAVVLDLPSPEPAPRSA